MAFKLESNVPIPSQLESDNYPFADMKVGDSFFVVVLPTDDTIKRIRSVKNSARSWAIRSRRDGWSCKTAIEPGGFRVWRTS